MAHFLFRFHYLSATYIFGYRFEYNIFYAAHRRHNQNRYNTEIGSEGQTFRFVGQTIDFRASDYVQYVRCLWNKHMAEQAYATKMMEYLRPSF